MPDGQDETIERGPAILTEAQRAFLRGEKEYAHEQSETDMRYKIRKRVRDALLDFALLFQELDARDREQLFKDVRPALARADEELLGEGTFREAESSALIYALAFFYRAASDVDFDFEKLVELAIVAERGADPANPFTARSVEVTIDEQLVSDHDLIRDRIEAGESLSEAEYLAVMGLLIEDKSEFVAFCRHTDVDVAPKVEAGTDLTVGESLVAGGEYLAAPGQYDPDQLVDCMDDRVAGALGL